MSESIKVTLTVTNGVYSIGDVVGGLITFSDAVRPLVITPGPPFAEDRKRRVVVNSIKLAGVVAIPYELWFFNADIATPAADNAALGVAIREDQRMFQKAEK
jgi:hypothetical protein